MLLAFLDEVHAVGMYGKRVRVLHVKTEGVMDKIDIIQGTLCT